MSNLNELAGKYGTDKSSHGFIGKYEELFQSFKNDELNFLEIGVFMGSSIKMWDEYFTNGKIFGIDSFEGIQGNKTTFDGYLSYYNEWTGMTNSKVELIKCDQSKEDELLNFKKSCNDKNITFKVIIDDGSHLMREQQITFLHFFDLLENGGFYIIEDSHTSDDLVGYDLLSDYSNSTKKAFLELKEGEELKITYSEDKDLLKSLAEKIESVYNFKSQNKISQTLIIKKK